MNYITNQNAIILILSNGEQVRVEKTDERYVKIVKVFDLPKDKQEDAVKKILNPEPVTVKAITGKSGFEVVGENVLYKGESLPQALVTKVLSIIRDGLPTKHFELFWERLEKNPSQSSVNELIDFLAYKELPISEDGYIIAYKGVNEDFYSVHGNLNTKVLQGKVDDQGRIYNGVGEVIEVRRRDVCDNRSEGCSSGLHVGSHKYASEFAKKLIIVKVDPADVVSVPKDCSFQKCRVCKYEVVAEYKREIKSSVVDTKGEETLVADDKVDYDKDVERIQKYLQRKTDEDCDQVTIRQIQNIFSPNYISKERVYDALQQLWYDWAYDEDAKTEVVYLDV